MFLSAFASSIKSEETDKLIWFPKLYANKDWDNSISVDETKIFEEWHESRDDESIAYFTEKLELIRLQLMEETKIQVSEDELQLLDKFSKSLTHRVKSTINQIIKTVNKQNKAS